MTVTSDFFSIPGLAETSLQGGQSFLDKNSADQEIKRHELAIFSIIE
jgi:hypothetical protein